MIIKDGRELTLYKSFDDIGEGEESLPLSLIKQSRTSILF